MKRLIFTFLIVLIQGTSNASIERVSYYFEENSIQLTNASLQEIEEFKFHTLRIYDKIQLIEMNSFATGSRAGELSKARLDYLVQFLAQEDAPIDFKVFGEKRIELNFEPKTWNRIDVYYYKPEEPKILPLAAQLSTDFSSVLPQASQPMEVRQVNEQKVESPKPELNHSTELPIMFEGGKWTILKKSLRHVEALKETLMQNPQLHVHIRGHVCCGNNKRISRKRARSVYTYLVSAGISKKRISFKGYGNTLPVAFPELNAHDRSMNRRVDVVFSVDENMVSNTAQNNIP